MAEKGNWRHDRASYDAGPTELTEEPGGSSRPVSRFEREIEYVLRAKDNILDRKYWQNW